MRMSFRATSRFLIPVLLAIVLPLCGCLRSPEEKKARAIANGKEQMQKKDYARAILEFKNAVKFGQKDPEPYYQLGVAYLASGDAKSAAALFRKSTELNPRHVGAQLQLAEMMVGSSRRNVVEQAEERAQKILASLPGNPDALDTLALAEFRLGKPDAAEQHLQDALAKFPKRLNSAVTLAKFRLARKDLKGAEEVLKSIAAQTPAEALAIAALGNFYTSVNRFSDAERELLRALASDGRNGPALLGLANVQLRIGRNTEAETTLRTLSRVAGTEYRLAYGLFLFQVGKRDLAIAEVERIFKEDPRDRNVRSRLVAAYASANRTTDAYRLLEAALRANSKDVDALLQRAALYIGHGNYAGAEKDLAEALHYRATSAEPHLLLASLRAVQGAMLREQQELGEALRLDPSQIRARVRLARSLIAGNSAQAALGVLSGAPAQQQKSIAYLLTKNWALLATGQKQEVRQSLDTMLSRSHESELLWQDALLKLDAKNYSAARITAEQALKQNPDDVFALDLLMGAYTGQHQRAAGLERVRAHAAKRTQSAAIQNYWGNMLIQHGDLPAARIAYSNAKVADPRSVTADIALARLDLADKNFVDGRKRLSKVVVAQPRNTLARTLLGDLELVAGNVSRAVEHYRGVVEIDPRNAQALNNLSYLLAESGNNQDEALRYAQQAKEARPNDPATEDTLGWALFHKGMYSMAVTHLEKAVETERTPLRLYHLAMAYAKNGDKTRSRKVFDSAVALDPNLPEAKGARQLLNE